ncbi:hypothetical protein [Cupriavidus sp. CP313]
MKGFATRHFSVLYETPDGWVAAEVDGLDISQHGPLASCPAPRAFAASMFECLPLVELEPQLSELDEMMVWILSHRAGQTDASRR